MNVVQSALPETLVVYGFLRAEWVFLKKVKMMKMGFRARASVFVVERGPCLCRGRGRAGLLACGGVLARIAGRGHWYLNVVLMLDGAVMLHGGWA